MVTGWPTNGSVNTAGWQRGVYTVTYARPQETMRILLGRGVARGGAMPRGDALSQLETLVGSAHDDHLVGNANMSVFNGGAGVVAGLQ